LSAPARGEGRLYRTAAALLILLALTVGLSFAGLGPFGFAAALAVAAAKALLVAGVFMELGEGVDAVRFLASAALVWLALLLAGTLADLVTRR
jgi:cytochrome c oxidase subunit IV